MNRIVIGTDGSADAQEAVREGLELATELGAAVTFVSVRTPPAAVWGAPVYQAQLENTVHTARDAVHAAVEAAADAGVEADYEVLDGPAVDAILAVAETHDADLIIVGSRGRGAVKGALFGSVSRALVSHADRPVLVVREKSLVAA